MSKLLSRTQKRVIIATSFGSILEWYEIFLYIYWAPLISVHFFSNKNLAEINAFSIFAIGFLSRPLGGFIFGHVGDRLGRKVAFVMSILLVSFPTIIIALLPSYEKIGILAPVLLAAMRILQGIPAGGELPGAICYLSEYSSENNRKLMSSFAFFGVGLGVMISISEYQILQSLMPNTDLEGLGWRFSFIFGGLLGMLGFYLRYRLHETPLFNHLKTEGRLLNSPILFSLNKYKRHLFAAFLCCILSTVGFYVICVFPTLYLAGSSEGNLQLRITFFIVMLSTLTLPLFGKLGERYELKSLLYLSGILILIFTPILYWFFSQKTVYLFILGEIILIGLLNVQFALIPSLLVDLFPTHIRYSGAGISFNLCDSLIGGVVPLLAFYLVRISGNIGSILILIGVAATFSLAGLYFIEKRLE